jgi:phage anti-repressor protein
MTSPSDNTTQLNRIYDAVEYMTNLEGQDRTLVIEMCQAMLSALIEGHDLHPLVEYVARYCDVIKSEAEAERIASEI